MLQLYKQYSMHSHTRHTALLSSNSTNIITDQEYNLWTAIQIIKTVAEYITVRLLDS